MKNCLRVMGATFNVPATVHCDNKDVAINTTGSRSTLSKKRLTLAYHFCPEDFSTEAVDMRWADGKHNLADNITKTLGTGEFYAHMSSAMSTY